MEEGDGIIEAMQERDTEAYEKKKRGGSSDEED